MRKSRVSIQYKVSDKFLQSLALAMYRLTIAEREIKNPAELFDYIVKHRLEAIESFTTKDLLLFADKGDLQGDIAVSIHLSKPTNDILSAARYRLAARAGRVVSNIELHRLAFSTITGE